MSITINKEFVPSSDGIHALSGKVYIPEENPKGLFHVVHGMTEHIERYDFFMRKLAEDMTISVTEQPPKMQTNWALLLIRTAGTISQRTFPFLPKQ